MTAETAGRRENFWKRVRRSQRARARWSPALNDAPVPSILSPHIRREAR
jgi:hypothetical protein